MTLKIHEITDEDIYAKLDVMLPIYQGKWVKVTRTPQFCRRTAYQWDPQFVGTVPRSVVAWDEIRTYHTYGYFGLFKPSVAEVLAMVPWELIKRENLCGFEIIRVADQPATVEGQSVQMAWCTLYKDTSDDA